MTSATATFNWRRAAAICAITVVIGPPVGAWALVGGVLIAEWVQFGIHEPLHTFPGEVIAAILWIAVLGYFVGGVPALLSGLSLGYISGRTPFISRLLAVSISVVATIVFLLFVTGGVPQGAEEFFAKLMVFLPSAVVSAFVCRWIAIRWGVIAALK